MVIVKDVIGVVIWVVSVVLTAGILADIARGLLWKIKRPR